MRVAFFVSAITIAIYSFAQIEIGPRMEIYPAGIISNIQVTFLNESGSAWNIKAGYNRTDRRDWGVQESEFGGGPGVGLDFRRYLKNSMSGLYLEAGVEWWFMTIDWFPRCEGEICHIIDLAGGRTNIIVLQPTFGAGYQVVSKNEKWSATAGLTFGGEMNIRTEGEEVGQGGISILAISLTRRL